MEFNNVTIVKQANIYFEGKVTSRTVKFDNGERKTLGVMLAGEYEFATNAKETMEILGGSMSVMLLSDSEFHNYIPGQSFVVPANSSFKIIVEQYVDYCCSYED